MAKEKVCENCGKGTLSGSTIQHGRGIAGKRWKKRAQKASRVFKPNLHLKTVVISGVTKQMTLCAKCIKKFKKEGKLSYQQTRTQDTLA